MTDTTPAVTPEMKKYNSSVGIKKVKAFYKKRARHDKKQVTRKQNIRDIIPINKTKKLKTPRQQYGGAVYSSKSGKKSNTAAKPSNVKKVEDKKKEVINTAVPPELVIQKNTKIDFLSMAKAKKREFKFMIFKKNSPEGQMTYLEAIYYQIMGYWQNVYKHLEPKHLEPKQKFLKNLYQILESSADAFQLHTSTGIQIVDNTTLSTGTNMDNYSNIVYCLSMMRRNARDNFLSSCDREVINYIGGLFKTAGKGITEGIMSVLKLTKALVKVTSIFGMRGGFDDMKKLYTELFNGNSLLKSNLKYAAKHKGKAGLICALFRYRRDQLVYNYFLDKFLVRMKLLFKTQADQINFLNGNHPLLYGKAIDQAKKYSINAITTTTATTFLTRFKYETETTGTKLEDIKKEIKAKLGSLASKLEMGNAHDLYTVLDNNEQIYYKYTTQNGKNVKVLKPIFNMNQGTDKKQTLNYDAAGLAHTYRIYHMLNHLYPNSSLLMETQAKLLTLYGLPRFDELSYHKKKFKNIRGSKNFAADFERFSTSINNISGTIDGYVNKLLSSIDYAVSAGTKDSPSNTIPKKEELRGMISFLQKERQKIQSMQEAELYNYRDAFKTLIATLFNQFTTDQGDDENEEDSAYGNEESNLTEASEYPRTEKRTSQKKLQAILEDLGISNTVINGIYSNKQVQRSTFIELINILISRVREVLSELVGNSVRVKYDRDSLPNLYKALGIKTPVDTSLIRGGGSSESSMHNSYDLDNWDGTDAYLDAHLAYKQTGGAGTQTGGADGDDYIDKQIGNDENRVNYLELREAGLKKLYKIIIDFLNSPHFINSGSKIDKVIYKLVPSGLGLDTGKGKDVGKESIFMELNYFNYLVKFEMGVLIFDDEQPNSELPLGTNLNRMVSGLPLFYETYLVNYFTDITPGGQTNYSCIGYQLADKKINSLLRGNGQTFIYDYKDESQGTRSDALPESATKGRILKENFGDASKVNEAGSRRKIPLSLLELTAMTPEELLSLMSLSSNVIMEKLISDKQASALNENLRSGKHVQPLVKFIKQLYGSDYYIGNSLSKSSTTETVSHEEEDETNSNTISTMSSGEGSNAPGEEEETTESGPNKYSNLVNADNVGHLKAITKFIKNEIQASKFWNRNTRGIRDALWNTNDSSITNIIKLILKVTGSVISGMLLVQSGLFVIPLACVVPWVATHLLYKHESYNTIYDDFTAYIDNLETAPVDLHNFWKNLTPDERDYIKAEGERLFKVNRELKYNYFYTSPIRDESGYTGTAITAKTILNNLNLLGFIDNGSETDITKTKKLTFLGIPIPGTNRTVYQKSIIACVADIRKHIKTDNQDTNLYIYVANLLIGRLTNEHKKILTVLVKNKNTEPEKYEAFKNIFTDQGQDNYGLGIFERLERQLGAGVSVVTPASKPEEISSRHDSSSTAPGSDVGPHDNNVTSLASWSSGTTQNSEGTVIPLEGGGGSPTPIINPFSAHKASSEARIANEKREILNVILGLNRYIDSIDMFTKAQDAVNESIARLQNTVARVVSGNKVKTVDDKLIKSGASEFKTQLLKGAFNGLYTTNMRLISESGVINLIQYYRNVLLDISNSERELIASTFERDESRIKYNKVLSKILVFLRLNLLFTDYVLQNSKLLSGNAGSPGDKYAGDGLADVIGDLLVRGGEPDSTEEEMRLPAPIRFEQKEGKMNVAGWVNSVTPHGKTPHPVVAPKPVRTEEMVKSAALAKEAVEDMERRKSVAPAPPAAPAPAAPAPLAAEPELAITEAGDKELTVLFQSVVVPQILIKNPTLTISFGYNESIYSSPPLTEDDSKYMQDIIKNQKNQNAYKNYIANRKFRFYDINFIEIIKKLRIKQNELIETHTKTLPVDFRTLVNSIYAEFFKLVSTYFNITGEPNITNLITLLELLLQNSSVQNHKLGLYKNYIYTKENITKYNSSMKQSLTSFTNYKKIAFILFAMIHNYILICIHTLTNAYTLDALVLPVNYINISHKIFKGTLNNEIIPIGIDVVLYKLHTKYRLPLTSNEQYDNTDLTTNNTVLHKLHGGAYNLKAMKTKKRNNSKSR